MLPVEVSVQFSAERAPPLGLTPCGVCVVSSLFVNHSVWLTGHQQYAQGCWNFPVSC